MAVYWGMCRSLSPSRVGILAAALWTLAAGGGAGAQTPIFGNIRPVESGSTASFRGISVARDGTIWIGGSKRTVLRSRDGGDSWESLPAPDRGTFDFRDVHAVSHDTAYLMVASQDTARIYKTTDAGAHWSTQYDSVAPGMFLDGIAFTDGAHGVAFGDPVDGRFVVLHTHDGGARWTVADSAYLPRALPGEAAFAASGTSIAMGSKGHLWFATGGASVSRVFRSVDDGKRWTVIETPLPAASSGAGIFSLVFRDEKHGIAVGGDYKAADSSRANVVVTKDGGVTWMLGDARRTVPYVSAVVYAGAAAFATGPLGTFRSIDDGVTWERIGSVAYNAIGVAPGGLIFVGERGAIGTLALQPQ
jgi:photosystem II stability/assembly factor-like uncharacterized protein